MRVLVGSSTCWLGCWHFVVSCSYNKVNIQCHLHCVTSTSQCHLHFLIRFRHNAKVHRRALPVPQLFSGMPSLVPGGRNSKQHPKQSVSCTLSYEWTLSETVTYQNSHSVVLTSLPEDELSHSGGPLQPLMGLLAQRVPPTCVLARRENSWCRAGRDP